MQRRAFFKNAGLVAAGALTTAYVLCRGRWVAAGEAGPAVLAAKMGKPLAPAPINASQRAIVDDVDEVFYNSNTDNTPFGGSSSLGHVASWLCPGAPESQAAWDAQVARINDQQSRVVLGSPVYGAFSCVAVDYELGYQFYIPG